MPVLSVFAVSLSAVFFEVLLNRSFAITQWVHMAFMVISIAMFGYSAGSVWVHLRAAGGKSLRETGLLGLPLAVGAGILLAWILMRLLPFDAVRLPFSSLQAVYLAAIFLLPAVPFFFAGMVTSLGFAARTSSPGVIYAASMIGGALGAVLPALLLPILGFEGCVLLSACIATVPSLLGRKSRLRIAAVGLMAAGAGLLLAGQITEPAPSSYKALEQFMQHPGARILFTDESIAGRLDAYEGSGFHSAPGLSLSYRGPIPEQTGLFTDAGSFVVLYSGSEAADYRFACKSVGAAPFILVREPGQQTRRNRVLVLLESGGAAIATALASGAREVDVLDFLPARAAAVENHYRGQRVNVIAGPVRGNLARLEKTYDVILIDHPGSSIPGVTSINEDFLLTTECFVALLRHLEPGGVLSVSRRLQIPPSDSLKAFAVAFEALEEMGYSRPQRQICIVRNYNTYTLTVGLEPFSETAVDAIKRFSADNGFDLVYLDGLKSSEANRYSRRPAPIYYDAVSSLASDLADGKLSFSKEYYVDISAPHDDKPYFNRLIRMSTLGKLYDATGGRPYPFYFTGEILVILIFAIALVFSSTLIMTPAIVAVRRGRKGRMLPGLKTSAIFILLGAGYMFFEIGWIKHLIPLTGSASTSFTAVLAVLLVASGFGGWLSERVTRRHLKTIGFSTVAALAISAVGMKFISPALLGLPPLVSWFVASLFVALPGVLLGMPLPLSMRYLCRNSSDQIFGWAANGTASVLTSIAAAGLVLLTGIQMLLWISFAFYACVFILYAAVFMNQER